MSTIPARSLIVYNTRHPPTRMRQSLSLPVSLRQPGGRGSSAASSLAAEREKVMRKSRAPFGMPAVHAPPDLLQRHARLRAAGLDHQSVEDVLPEPAVAPQ